MEINFLKSGFKYNTNAYGNTGTKHKELLNMINKLNSSCNYTQIGDTITLKDGTTMNVNDIPKLNVGLLDTAVAKDNVMDFGSACYFKYTNSTGKSLAIFSMPGGAICRPISEDMDFTGYDRETERYIHFWNNLGTGTALMSSLEVSQQWGYSDEQIRGYLDEAGISKGFFTVKMGSANSEFFYSGTKQYPIYSKEKYDLRYLTMTSSNYKVFSDYEPGTEITIAGEKYTLKEDHTLDIPYGTDIYDIQLPKYKPPGKTSAGIDCKV